MDEIRDLIDELIEKNNQKLQTIYDISTKVDDLGLTFVVNEQQLKKIVCGFINELKELKNVIE